MDEKPPPPLRELFAGFLSVGVYGFGGVLPWARRMIVEQRKWLSPADFNDMLALCQFLPGGNALNLSAAIGLRFAGVVGAVACVAGMMAPPVVIVVAMGTIYERYRDVALVRGLFVGLGAGAAGLIVGMSLKIATALRGNPMGIALALVCFVAMFWLQLPLLVVLLVMVPASVLLAWRFG